MQILNDFVMYLSLEKGLSKNTCTNYFRDIKQFFNYTNKNIEDINFKDISNFIMEKRKNYSTTTTNRKLSALKTFFKYLVRMGLIDHNPAQAVECGKVERKLPQPIEEKDIDKIINITDNLRDEVIFEVLYGTGVRREELINIKVKDINFNKGYIRVFGKGKKERLVPIHPTALNKIRELTSNQNSQWLFPSRKNKGHHISLRRVNEIVTKWAKKAGVEGVTPHKFRHSFCTYMYENGAELKTIQDIAGHASANTTNIYTKVSNQRNMKEYMMYHPRANI